MTSAALLLNNMAHSPWQFTFALNDIKLNAQSWQRGENVTEENDAIRLESAPRLQRELNGNVCR